MTESIDVVVCGHLCLDLLPGMDHLPLQALPTPGRLFEVGQMVISTGGAVSNTGLALHRLGMTVRLMGVVGDDPLGMLTRQYLAARAPALAESIRVQQDVTSAYTIVLAPERVDRIFLHNPGPNATFNGDDIDFDMAARARLFHFGYPPIMPAMRANNGAELVRVYHRVQEMGVATGLDMSMPDPAGDSARQDWHAFVQRVLPHVDVFVPSIGEIVFMLRRSDYNRWGGEVTRHVDAAYLDDLAAALMALGPAIVGFKLGRRGVILYGSADRGRYGRLARAGVKVSDWADQRAYHPAFAVTVAGTTGSGDAAYAGLLAALLHGLPPAEVVRWACAVGACNVEAADATSGIRTWSATQDRLEADWPTLDDHLPGL